MQETRVPALPPLPSQPAPAGGLAPAGGFSPTLPPLPLPLEVESLLTASRPRPSALPGSVLLVGLAFAIALISGRAAQSAAAAIFINLGLTAVAVVLVATLARTSQRHRREQQLLADLHQRIQLKRWPEAADTARTLLSSPMLLPPSRYQAMIYLAAVLGRYQRYAEALQVMDVVIEEGRLDPGSDAGMQAARILALLREERLVDADQALSQLKRRTATRTAGLAMMELYRAVKTGHHQDALEMFQRDLPMLRAQTGHRQGDAWALAARAAQALGKVDDARRMAGNALLLMDGREIVARFPEVAGVLQAEAGAA